VLVITLLLQTVTWFVLGPVSMFLVGAFVIAFGLSIPYGQLGNGREVLALMQAGIPPRRSGAAVVRVMCFAAVCEATAACVLRPPAIRSEYVGYVLLAAQLPLMASAALPISAISQRSEPWARMGLLLLGYALAIVVLRVIGRSNGLAPGLEWMYVDSALLAADVWLYRYLERPRAGT
jgi:hypothetical protein